MNYIQPRLDRLTLEVQGEALGRSESNGSVFIIDALRLKLAAGVLLVQSASHLYGNLLRCVGRLFVNG